MNVWHLSTMHVASVQKTLITGADSGIGRAVALAFAREGADVAIAYLNEHKDAEVPFGSPADIVRHGSLHVSCAYAMNIAAQWAIPTYATCMHHATHVWQNFALRPCLFSHL